jgi:hypothetical protein
MGNCSSRINFEEKTFFFRQIEFLFENIKLAIIYLGRQNKKHLLSKFSGIIKMFDLRVSLMHLKYLSMENSLAIADLKYLSGYPKMTAKEKLFSTFIDSLMLKSNSVITNSSGPVVSVRYNRGSL